MQGDPNTQLMLQEDFEVAALRSDLIVPPPSLGPRWEERLFFDARIRRTLLEGVEFVISDRFNLRAEEHLRFPDHEDVRNDLREAYLAWTIDPETFLNVGRFNLKSGVALGFNPTDFFKTRAVVEPLSADPSVLREDRLGTLVLMGEHLWMGGSLTVAFAPRLTAKSAIYGNAALPSFNPMFDRTNAVSRALVKVSFNLSDDLSPELLAYFEDGHARFGANLTYGFGQNVVGYAEWAGGERANLVTDAIAYGRATGTIPALAPQLFATDPARFFRNDLSLGASYTTDSKITFNLEYHFHQAGFSASDWRDWFAVGALRVAPLDAELWYIRGYAADQQEPLARNSLFLRADRQDAFIPNLELSGFVNLDLRDGSALAQANAGYYLSRQWTIGAQASATWGGKRSDFGSLPGAATVFLSVSRYF
ncbi:MAG: hypothetical protein HY243_01910 [Proteobacteria bacterium]|nr:hypothetical protein [Pseudomonadota bacterium]